MKPTPEQLEQRIRDLEDNQRKILDALKTANILIPRLNSPSKSRSVFERSEFWGEGTCPGKTD